MKRLFLPAAAVAFILMLSACNVFGVKHFDAKSVYGELKGSPITLASSKALNLVWEMSVADFRKTDGSLIRIDIIDQGTGIILDSAIFGTSAGEYSPTLWFPPYAEEPKFFFWTRLDPQAALPESIIHRLTFRTATGSEELVELCPFVPGAQEPAILSAPFESGDWLIVETTNNSNHHRLSDTTVNGRIVIPQRFAGDWHKVEGGGVSGADPDANEDYYCFGQNLLAAKAGTVVFALTGLDDNAPGVVPDGLTLDTVPGNCVVIDIGDGRYLQYAHLKKDSITVSVGQILTAGTPIGKVGNSGNSTAPHLHLQVSDSPGFLDGEGLPFVFDGFTSLAELEPADPLVFPSVYAATTRILEIPENRSIVAF